MQFYSSEESEAPNIPWLDGKPLLKGDLHEMLSNELKCLEDWLSPTEIEQKTRLLTILKISNLIEYYYSSSVVIAQGSSATDTYLPTSDIDLIVTQVKIDDSHTIVRMLKDITRLLWKHKLIEQGVVIPHARVPIVKCVERCFGYHIDICISNVNGVLNVPRVKKILTMHPMLRTLFMFMKLFVFLFDIDDPATGGFGSNLLLNICLFAIQSYKSVNGGKEPQNVGSLLLYLMDVLGNKINYYLCGVTTVFGGQLFSKRLHDQLDSQCPAAFVFEDPQLHDVFIGCRTYKSLTLQQEMRNSLEKIQSAIESPPDDGQYQSILDYFLPDVSDIVKRRQQIREMGELMEFDPEKFVSIVSSPESRIWKDKETNPVTIFNNRVIRITPEAEPVRNFQVPKRSFINRSLSTPEVSKAAEPKKNVWKTHAKKKFNKNIEPPTFKESKSPFTAHMNKKAKKGGMKNKRKH